jgi:hypothetical protein
MHNGGIGASSARRHGRLERGSNGAGWLSNILLCSWFTLTIAKLINFAMRCHIKMDQFACISTAFAGIGTAYAIRNYFKTLKDYLDPTLIRTKRRIQNRYFEYDMDQNGDILLWRDLLKTKFNNPTGKILEEPAQLLRVGDMVELNNANITRWVPLFPGKKYSNEGEIISKEHATEFPDDHEYGLEEELISRNNAQVLSGSATTRILPFNKEVLLCASGELCETGIPMILTERMYSDKLQSMISKDGGVKGKIIGTLVELPGEWKDRLDKTSINKLDKNIYGLPRLSLIVDQIRQLGTPSLVFADAWTQFINSDRGYSSMINSIFKPTLLDDIDNSINMLANYERFLESSLIGGNWDIDIEFDETRNWFAPGNYKIFDLGEIDIFRIYYEHPRGRMSDSRKPREYLKTL